MNPHQAAVDAIKHLITESDLEYIEYLYEGDVDVYEVHNLVTSATVTVQWNDHDYAYTAQQPELPIEENSDIVSEEQGE